MKYKIGDKVRIKSFDWYYENKDMDGFVRCGDRVFDDYMSVFCGSVVTIGGMYFRGYSVREDMQCRTWTDEMIEGLVEEESEKKLSDESWKPSKEEMDVLYGLAYITNQYDEHKEEIITRLYQDLKREFFNGSSYENMFPDTEDDVRRRSTIQILEYARSLDNYNQYGKEDIDKNIAWLEKQGKKPQGKSALEAMNEKNIDNQNCVKPTDRVEPKFKVGDKIKLKSKLLNDIFGVIGYESEGYRITNISNGLTYFMSYSGDKVQIKSSVDELIREIAEGIKIAQDTKTFLEGYNQGYEDGQHDMNEWILPEGFEFTDEKGNVINTTKVVLKKKKRGYPETYEECRLINGDKGRIPLKIIGTFTRLINARNAYWKVAGEEMGLSKPWKPDWKDACQHKHCIYTHGNKITEGILFRAQAILAFPTEEMKSAFKESFDADIEICKELL